MKNKILFALSLCLVATVSFGQDLERFYNNAKYGYKDPSKGWKGVLKPAIKAKYYQAEEDGFKGCNTAIVRTNPKNAACCEEVRSGVIDKTGAAIIPIEYKAVFRHKNSGYIMMRKEADDKRGLIHKDGKIIFPAEYKVMTLIGNDDWLADSHPTMLMFGKDNKYGLMLLSTEKMTPMHFERIITHDYIQSYAVKLNGKWAFINNNFEEITPYKYTNMGWSNDNNSFWCEIDGAQKLIDAATGKEGGIYTGEKPKDYSGGSNNNTSKPSTPSNSSSKKDECTYKCKACNKVVQYSCSYKPGDECPVLTQKAAASGGGGRKGHEWSKQ
jgi:hypothetical protein